MMKNREGYYEDGTKVLIFKTKGEGAPLRDEDGDFIVGTIVGRTESDDLAYHGSAWYEYIYTVADENGKRYYGTYRCITSVGEPYYFFTIEDYKEIVEYKIAENKREIRTLLADNSSYFTELVKLKQLENIHNQEVKKNK